MNDILGNFAIMLSSAAIGAGITYAGWRLLTHRARMARDAHQHPAAE